MTGCAGFIGARVVELLLHAGHTVIGVDNLNTAYDLSLKKWRLGQIADRPGFTFQQIDITNRRRLAELGGRGKERPFDAVINLAARAGVRYSVENPWVYFETNVTGTLNLLELCREFGVGKFVLASSSSVYGTGQPGPFRENMSTDRVVSPYAASKKSAEELCFTYHYLHGIDVTVLRFFTGYGPAGRPDMMPFCFVQWISEGRPLRVYGNGQQSRDFTYVDDIAQGTIAALRPLGYEIINLGSDEPVTVNDAIALIEELVGKKARRIFKPAHPADVMATWASIGKAEHLLAWRPQYTFRKGVEQLVNWYRQNREWAREIAT